ncbi:MAG: L-2-hydroxyglutarate oxidase [Gemmatimonadota bacterium]
MAAAERTRTADYLIVGGGIVGLALALEVRRRHPGATVTVLEKEEGWGAHASGRNSGVLHAGFYYAEDSLKARLTRAGCARMAAYCRERGLGLNPCGKLVVARDASELPGLDELFRRGAANGVELHEVSAAEARELEPRVRTHERALWSPTTASVDPLEVVRALAEDAEAAGVRLHTGTAFTGRRGRTVQTNRGHYEAGHVINAAGLHADVVARQFGFSEHYRILPFKGVYLKSAEPAGAFRRHIYPVPHLARPWLGVHVTVSVDGHAKIGPTAIPAFWREHYGGLANFRAGELFDVLRREAALFLTNAFQFRDIAFEELAKYRRAELVRQAAPLARGIRAEDYRQRGRPGIRAQLLDVRTRRLEMDFVVEGDEHSTHVLNAVSPAFTCALPFAELVLDRLEEG